MQDHKNEVKKTIPLIVATKIIYWEIIDKRSTRLVTENCKTLSTDIKQNLK